MKLDELWTIMELDTRYQLFTLEDLENLEITARRFNLKEDDTIIFRTGPDSGLKATDRDLFRVLEKVSKKETFVLARYQSLNIRKLITLLIKERT